MFDVPITSGANAFIWGFVILIAFVVALMVVDVIKSVKSDNVKTKEKKIL
jgi:hypothetical protein